MHKPDKPDQRATDVLRVQGLHLYYGQSHALQGVDLTLPSGVLSVVGRNGMGKTSLCKAIMGLAGTASGSIKFEGVELRGMETQGIARLGVGYVPQGRGLWKSLTVDEHLQLSSSGKREAPWTVERVYETFPRLAERRRNRGQQLSGGEQQMLAIGRALLQNPRLLVMDEPTEGLAPVVVSQVEALLVELAKSGTMSVLVIEQNIGVATRVAQQVAIMVNGRVSRVMPTAELAADRDLQQRLLGVGRHGHDEEEEFSDAPQAQADPVPTFLPAQVAPTTLVAVPVSAPAVVARRAAVVAYPRTASAIGHEFLVVGDYGVHGAALRHLRDALVAQSARVRTVDISLSGNPSSADVPPYQLCSASALGQKTRSAMARGLRDWLHGQTALAGVVGLGSDPDVCSSAFGALPLGMPKMWIGSDSPVQAVNDILWMPLLVDPARPTQMLARLLDNAAQALSGMSRNLPSTPLRMLGKRDRPVIGITQLVTEPLPQEPFEQALGAEWELAWLAADRSGSRVLGRMLDCGLLAGGLDLFPVDVVAAALAFEGSPSSRSATQFPDSYASVLACGGLDHLRFKDEESIPPEYRDRGRQVDASGARLIRLSANECRRVGSYLAAQINEVSTPLTVYLPTAGMSVLGQSGHASHDPTADQALFEELERHVRAAGHRRLVRLPWSVHDPRFVAQVLADWQRSESASRRIFA